MAIRPDEFYPIILGRRIFQQCFVDNYAKIDNDRIQFCNDGQNKQRAKPYKDLLDFLRNAANNINAQVGEMIVRPSSFIGSPRNMARNYQDAVTILREEGKPD